MKERLEPTVTKSSWINIYAGAFLFLSVFAVYSGCLNHQFLSYDDPSYITQNETIRGFSLSHLQSAFTGHYLGNYAPLHLVSYMVDYTIWGLRPSGFILTNIILHAINTILLFWMLLRIQGSRTLAVFSAFLFAFHPVQVESVAWATERKNVLAMFFFLLSLHAHIRFRETSSWRWYSISFLTFACALLTKSVVVILPLVILLYDFFHLDKKPKKILMLISPYLVIAAACSFMAILTQAEEVGGGIRAYHGGSLWTTGLSMFPVFVAYLKLIFWPVNLSLIYMPDIKHSIDFEVAGAFILMLAVAGIGWLVYRVQRRFVFWLGIFFLGLLPVSQLIPLLTMMNDRYLYFPMLGAAPFCTGAIALLWHSSTKVKAAVIVAAMIPVFALPALTWQRTKVWSDNLTLWQDTVERVPESRFALLNLARTSTEYGRPELALKAHERLNLLNDRVSQPGEVVKYDMYENIR